MIRLQSLRLKNAGLHKRTDFHFTPGIHVIRGENRDTKDGSANAVGKSSLFMPLHTVVQGEMLWAHRKGQMPSSGGIATLNCQIGEDNFRLKLNTEKNHYAIAKNGKEMGFRTKPESRAYVRSLFPWSEELFRSTIYLNQQIPNPVLKASPTNRHILFESLFQVSIIDQLYKWVLAQQSSLKDASTVLKTLEAELPEACPTKDDMVELEALRDSLQRKVETASIAISEQAKEWQKAETRRRLVKGIPKQFRKLTVRDLTAQYDGLGKTIAKLEKKLDLAKRVEAEAKQAAELKGLINQLSGLRLEGKLVALKERLRELQAKEQRSGDAADRLEAMQSTADRWKEFQRARKPLPIPAAIPIYEWDNWLTDQRHAELRKISLLKKKSANCPVCRTRLDEKHHSRLLQEARAALKAVEELADTARPIIKRFKDLKEPDFDEIERLKTLASRSKSLEQKIDKTMALIQAHEQARDLKTRIDTLKNSISGLSCDESSEDLDSRISKLEKQKARLEEVLQTRRTIETLGPIEDVEDPEKLREKHRKMLDRLNVVQSKFTVSREQRTRWKDVNGKILPLRKKLKDSDPLLKLSKLLGPKGIRSQLIRQLFDQYLENLNTNAPLIFKNPVKFQAVWGSRTLEIMAKQGKNVSDTRLFSGFEGKAFEILHLIALYPLLPASWRCNVTILDEMEANLSTVNRRRLAETLIPALASQSECVVVITPLTPEEFYIPHAKEWCVVRENGTASLVEIGK